jgi:hypothetical protein
MANGTWQRNQCDTAPTIELQTDGEPGKTSRDKVPRVMWRVSGMIGIAVPLSLWCAAGCSRGEGKGRAPAGVASALEAGAPRPTCAELDRFFSTGEGAPSPPPDPAVTWAAIEECGAPTGDTCEKSWAATRTVPSMAHPTREEGEQRGRDFVEACRTLPADVQRCGLVSYALSHATECTPVGFTKRVQKLIDQKQKGI